MSFLSWNGDGFYLRTLTPLTFTRLHLRMHARLRTLLVEQEEEPITGGVYLAGLFFQTVRTL